LPIVAYVTLSLPGREPIRPWDIHWFTIKLQYPSAATCEVQSHFHSCFFGTLQHMLNFKGPIGSDPIVTATFIYTIESQFQKKLHFQYCLEHYFVNFCIVACANFGPTWHQLNIAMAVICARMNIDNAILVTANYNRVSISGS
jgi:hypothetical protein